MRAQPTGRWEDSFVVDCVVDPAQIAFLTSRLAAAAPVLGDFSEDIDELLLVGLWPVF
jgi:hypothetical protein